MLSAVAAFVLTAGLAHFQAPDPSAPWPDDRPITRVLQNLGRDLRALPSAPTAIVLAAGGGGAAAAHAADADMARRAADAGDAGYTVAGRWLGDGWVQAGGALATYAVGRLAGQPRVTHVGSDLVRVQALNGVLTTGLKYAVDRRRPSGGRYAFPSGHTSATFASASVLHAHFGWKAAAPAYIVAGYVGWTRVRDRKHWMSDVVFGAAVGLATGHAVTKGHRKRDWGIVPLASPGGKGLEVRWIW